MKYMIRQMQLQKIIGELRALEATFYDPMHGSTEEWRNAHKVINSIVDELKNNFG